MNPQTAPQPPHGIFDLEASSTLWLTQLLLWSLPLLVFLGIFALWLWKKRQAARKVPNPPDPWLALGQRLNKLEWHETLPTEYVATLSNVLRAGLEEQQGKPFLAWTKVEVLRELQLRGEFSSDFQASCAEFLEAAEKVQYGGRPLDESTALAWKGRVQDYLKIIREPAR